LETWIKTLGKNYEETSEVTQGKKNGQPMAMASFFAQSDDGHKMTIDVLMTYKGNRLYIIQYIRGFSGDILGALFLENFKLQ